MDVKKSSFQSLPFNTLFKDYTAGKDSIKQFFQTHPADKDSVDSFVDSFTFKGNRDNTVSLLERYNEEYLSDKTTRSQIDKIKHDDTLCVVTGQQVTLFGGPLFTIYKTITAILYARKYEKIFDRPVIPVFWLADEDHDIEEISSITLPDSYSSESITYTHNEYSDPPPASTIVLNGALNDAMKQLTEQLDETDFTGELLKQIEQCYRSEKTFGEAFGALLMSYFGKHGLVLAGSLDKEAKQQTRHLIQTAVTDQESIAQTLDDTTFALKEAGYHDQVQVQSSNLFYITEEGARVKLQVVDQIWKTENKSWTEETILEEIDRHPERFSPNVFLRPILQDQMLPVIAYVGGPGEVSYYAQMKEFYNCFNFTMPVILPRFSITLFESSIDRIVEKLPFEWQTYKERIEDLEKRYVETTDTVDIEKLFGIWRSQIDELSRAKREEIGEIDPSLKGSVGKAKATYFSELDKLKGKVYRSVKEQENVQLDRIRRIKNNIFPNGNLQEREVAFIYYMNKYGLDLWDRVIDSINDEEPYNHLTLHL